MASKKALRRHHKAERRANSSPVESNRSVLDARALDEFTELLDDEEDES